ncbi:pentatricopeptide repeat-containing protein At3g24000, mitochondrial-like [Nymphaea colorata]|uniref:pentatricopeptide repeat-containing protein At3g24000, mitochondrial-like n=1 Tax=Nymphaea colorata TaxID=210225 RepID=UPI00129E4DA2|nr:pentatricopeptide repeat-containing protein At3g24000, mitochondrial-like [Nymphaea colorata]XP_031486335.1 pentatricopeptide repeat-containing protein At3g24000, mitochondrial-like [Nymphaea colorata]XP_031486336.1 pentatricopeptide repeat-containing protein At3g24000, mitochondrial-like [Nymphaea colorata]
MHSYGFLGCPISRSSIWRNDAYHHFHLLKKPRTMQVAQLSIASVALPVVETDGLTSTLEIEKNMNLRPLPTSSFRSGKQILMDYSTMVLNCTKKLSIREGKSVHGNLIRNHVEPDMHLYNCLIGMYAKFGLMPHARKMFDSMPRRDVVSWNSLFSGYVAECRGDEAITLFCNMVETGIQPNEFALATGLKACALCFEAGMGELLHAHALKRGFLADVVVGCALVDLYSKCGEMKHAESVFWRMSHHNSISWNALLSGYAQLGNAERVLDLFQQLTEEEVKWSKFILSSVLKVCACMRNIREGKSIHALLVKTGINLDGFLQSCLLDVYAKCGLVEDAHKIFARIPVHDVVSWSAMITCFAQHGYGHEAFQSFCDMRKTNIMPNQFTLASIISSITDVVDDKIQAASIHGYVIKVGFDLENIVGNALVQMYMKFDAVQEGCRVFDLMVCHDTISWNALLSGFQSSNSCLEGLNTFIKMLLEDIKPNKYSFVSVLRSCTNLLGAKHGEQVHTHVIKHGLEEDCFVGTALIDLYAKYGFLVKARRVFDRMLERDVFTWTVIITGYAHNDEGEQALRCFQLMQREGINANQFTLASCLNACSSNSALGNGCQFHSWIIKSGLLSDIYVASSLVDMYSKCGCMEEAETLFHDLDAKDVVAWNTLICSYSQHGLGKKALGAFKDMLEEGLRPDEVTFLGILSACNHVGLIKEGKQYFESMNQVYGINPTMEHLACMVGILGRAGNLDEVKSFIERMSLTPDALIWEAVLGACRMHGNVELGEEAAEKLFEIDPLRDSTYILLSNIYAAAGKWSDVVKVRQKMSDSGVKKEPGCSWIEIDGRVHIFVPHDASHVHAKEIYAKLDELNKELSLAGYVPDTKLALHNVNDDEKKESLLYHSERLALAYGLICTNSPKIIRIFKNLRICGDCHNAMKFISSITKREIVIRDINRFHHFKAGYCSCHDYW